MYVVLVEGVDNSPLKVGRDALGVELVWPIVFGVQAFRSPSHIALIDVGVAQLDDVDIDINQMYITGGTKRQQKKPSTKECFVLHFGLLNKPPHKHPSGENCTTN